MIGLGKRLVGNLLKYVVGYTDQTVRVLLCLITLWGSYLRFYDLGRQSLWLDEAVSVVHAQGILQHGIPLLLNGQVSWSAFPSHYLMALGMAVVDDVHWGGRMMSAIAGSILILLSYALGHKVLKSRTGALASASMMAFLTIEVAWSRQARLYTHLQLFSLTSLLCGVRYIDRRQLGDMVVCLGCCILAISTHRAGYHLIPVLAVLWLMRTRSVHEVEPWSWRKKFFAILGVIVAVSPIVFIQGNSDLQVTMRELLAPSMTNYSSGYAQFLWQGLGAVLCAAILGGVMSLFNHGRLTTAMIFGIGIYLYVIVFQTQLFAARYLLPIVPALILLASYVVAVPTELAKRYGGASTAKTIVVGIVTTGLWLAIILNSPIRLTPETNFYLDYTAPQAKWREAYALIKQREETRIASGYVDRSQAYRTLSAIPIFHDIYLGSDVGEKRYMPVTFTGRPGDVQMAAAYTAAITVKSLEELKQTRGYAVLDDFSLRMAGEPSMRSYLASNRPNAIVPGPNNLYIWILPIK